MKASFGILACIPLLSTLAFAQFAVKVDVKMVEVYVSVTDGKGKPVVGLQQKDFRVSEDNRPQEIRVFEPSTSALTLALMVDTTASATSELPHVKNAIARLLTSLGPEDSVGLFTFATNLTTLSNFTTDRRATLGAMLQTRAAGATALFDSLTQVSRDVSRISGKKAILLFTDGDDNFSSTSLEASLRDTKRVGVPVYAMLYGRALGDATLLKRLEDISEATGGKSFRIRDPRDLPSVFQRIAEDMAHFYLVGYQSEGEGKSGFRTIKVQLDNPGLTVRSKEGYWP